MDVVLDALLDTLKVFPFLFLIYILIELLEHRTSITQNQKFLQGNLAPLVASATGVIPQCGFSVMAAKLYDKGFIRTGTLLAVFISTSDEALVILLSEMSEAQVIMPLILIKLVAAAAVGYLVNFLLSGEKLSEIRMLPDEGGYSCGHEHEGRSDVNLFLVSPLLHALKISLYLLIVNLVFGFIIEAVGEDVIASTLIGGPYVQPLITSLVGLIPNCASSVILTGAYINGGIMFGSLIAGLSSNAGLGLVVLLKNPKKLKRNILLIVALYAIAVLLGLLINSIMVLAGWA